MASLDLVYKQPPSYRWPVVKTPKLCVAMIGPGGIGSTLIAQLQEALPALAARLRLKPEIRAVCNSKQMLLAPLGLPLNSWRQLLACSGDPCSFSRLEAFLSGEDDPVAVIDTTASAQVAALHPHWLRLGYHVLTANKLAASAPSSVYASLRQAEEAAGGRYYCETTVGAGLPVISVLQDFVRTGDKVLQVEGVLSGTLSHLYHRVEQGVRFSEAVRALHSEGFTEPDPRCDLAGMDVARKLVILARVAGMEAEVGDVEVASCVALRPAAEEDLATFLATCHRYDEVVSDLSAKAHAQGAVLRYVATAQRGGKARVGLTPVPLSHPFARLRPGDNLVQITTARYQDNPLVIQGPGAGRAVTAAGLLADLWRCADSAAMTKSSFYLK